jgi:hypothetical protein
VTEPDSEGTDGADRGSAFPPATGRSVGPAGPSYPGPIQPSRPGVSPSGLPSSGPPSIPLRPPVPTGVPERPTPLPPPRVTAAAAGPAQPRPASAGQPPGTGVREPLSAPRPGYGAAGSPRPSQARPAPTAAAPTAAAPTAAAPTTLPGGTGTRPIRSRKAKLSLRRLDPWSVFVMSLMLSLFLAVVTLVAAVILYAVLNKLGIPKSINKAVTDVQGGSEVLTRGRFLGGAALLAAANVVLLTLFATLGSLLYNLSASFTGGLELTLAERD